jgi:N-methylhydantoinase A
MMRIGIDVGGTFTDFILVDEEHERHWVVKVPSTPMDPSEAIIHGLEELLELASAGPEMVEFVGHGTTVATNAFLQRRGARMALVTTKGFRDSLEFRRLSRDGPMGPYDIFFDFPTPLVPRVARLEVSERLDHHGNVLKPLDLTSVDSVIDRLRELRPEAIAICLLHSYANPEHERMLKQRIAQAMPGVYLSVSHEVNPEILEYERASTTVVNGYLGPAVVDYLRRLDEAINGMGMPGVRVLTSNGGVVSAQAAAERPVSLLRSGPAGGVAACVRIGESMGIADLVTLDVGGTSTDVAIVHQLAPSKIAATQIDGHAIRCQMIDIRSIGAGGGSLVWLDATGGVHVGPQSAGADPGPVCYQRGGTIPTVTDAAVALGLLDPAAFLGGRMKLSREAARESIGRIAARVSMTTDEFAAGVLRIANANMAAAVRVALVERGFDPRDFALGAFGGAGPIHATSVARELGIGRVVIPAYPGITSALGVATTDLVYDAMASIMKTTNRIDPLELERSFQELEHYVIEQLAGERVFERTTVLSRTCDVRYIGQYHQINVGIDRPVSPDALNAMLRDFHRHHEDLYGFSVEGEPVMLLTARVEGRVRVYHQATLRLSNWNSVSISESARERTVAWGDSPRSWRIHDRWSLAPGSLVEGPCILEQMDTTIVVLDGQLVMVDPSGNLLIEDMERTR